MHNTATYLLNNAGQYVHKWISTGEPGRTSYLLENGHLIRASAMRNVGPSTGGGEGGRIEEYDWDGNLVWAFDYYGANYIAHHDFKVLPNGNVLILAVEKKTYADAMAAGFNPNLLDTSISAQGFMLPEYQVEVQSVKPYGVVVWEWHMWDHMVQDYAAAMSNYGVVASHLEAAIGYTPSTPTAKYRIAFSANLSAFDVLNFTKDLATGNLALAQAQTDSRASITALSCTRNAFFVLASTIPGRTSVLRLINTNAQAGTLMATAYNDDGNTVGTVNAPLGSLAAQQMLGFTSAQLEAAIGYIPASSDARYRVVFNANLPNFELINFIQDVATGSLTLGQAQVDNRTAGTASTTVRNALFVNAASSANQTSVIRLINPGSQAGTVTATAYSEAGATAGTVNAALGSVGAQQMLTYTSAQLEAAIAYTASSGTAKYRILFTTNLPNLEIVNYVKDVASGNLTLGQDQIN